VNVSTSVFISDRVDKYLAYHDSVFYAASSKNIKLFTLVDDLENGQEMRTTPEESDICTISPDDMKIHGLIINENDSGDKTMLVPMETLDNQIDFNTLDILNKPPGDDFSYEFKQFREVVPRNDRFDPVKQFVAVCDKWNDIFAVALRSSSKVDFYYNGQRVSSFNGNFTILLMLYRTQRHRSLR
jgi:hypothetical protein